MKILVLNAGSSSHKLTLFNIENDQPAQPLWQGNLDWDQREELDRLAGLQHLLQDIWELDPEQMAGPQDIDCIGHRVVHGGAIFQQPTLITAEVKEEIKRLSSLAPLHNPANLEGIDFMQRLFPDIPQVAVFDTAFHLTMPEVIKTYPIPRPWKEEGIQRYGFHGISHHYCAERIPFLLNRSVEGLNIINCHLGNGASLCAIQNGKSLDTTMGFTPMEGLMMGTRCGSIDPGILLYLLESRKISVEELTRLLNYESGLKSIGGASDMRALLENPSPQSKFAIDMYVYRLKGFIGMLAAHLENIHVLSFTGGVGENAAPIREAACQGLQFLGIELDLLKNRECQPDQVISSESSSVKVLVIHTQEEWMIARACRQILSP